MPTKSLRTLLVGSALLWSMVPLLHSPTVNAASGVTVSPAFVRISLTAAQPAQDTAISVRNNAIFPVAFTVQASDVDIRGGTMAPLATQSSAAVKALTIQTPQFTLQPDKSINVLVHIDGSALPAGGQYAAIIIKQITNDPKTTVPISQAVSVGLFISKEVGVIRSLKLTAGLPHGVLLSMPSSQKFTFTNTGNTDVVPRAAISVMHGSIVDAKTTINEVSETQFAGQSRSFTAIFNYQHKLWPGRYSVQVTYRYDGQEVPIVAQASFWYLPAWCFILLFAILGIGARIGFLYAKKRNLVTAHKTKLILPQTIAPTTQEMPIPEKPKKKKSTRQKAKKVSKEA